LASELGGLIGGLFGAMINAKALFACLDYRLWNHGISAEICRFIASMRNQFFLKSFSTITDSGIHETPSRSAASFRASVRSSSWSRCPPRSIPITLF